MQIGLSFRAVLPSPVKIDAVLPGDFIVVDLSTLAISAAISEDSILSADITKDLALLAAISEVSSLAADIERVAATLAISFSASVSGALNANIQKTLQLDATVSEDSALTSDIVKTIALVASVSEDSELIADIVFVGAGPVSEFSTLFTGAERVVVPHAAAQNSTTAYTFSAWIKRTPSTSGTDAIASKWTYSSDGGWTFAMSSFLGALQLFIATQTNSTLNDCVVNTAILISPDTWYHLAWTFSPSTPTIYINGEAITPTGITGTVPAALQASTAPFVIGDWDGSFGGGGRRWAGYIDEVTTWNDTLDAAEIVELFNGGAPGDPTAHSKSANLISYYPMGDDPDDFVDSGGDIIIVDSHGGLNGVITNGSAASNKSAIVPLFVPDAMFPDSDGWGRSL